MREGAYDRIGRMSAWSMPAPPTSELGFRSRVKLTFALAVSEETLEKGRSPILSEASISGLGVVSWSHLCKRRSFLWKKRLRTTNISNARTTATEPAVMPPIAPPERPFGLVPAPVREDSDDA